ILMLKDGTIAHHGTSREVIQSVYSSNHIPFKPYIPTISRLYLQCEQNPTQSKLPLTVKETRAWIAGFPAHTDEKISNVQSSVESESRNYLSLKNVHFQYGRHEPMILKNLTFKVAKREFVALVGGNGSGKTTLLKTCIGMVKPQRGFARLKNKDTSKLKGKELYGEIAYLPQNPRTYFVHDTFKKEMLDVINRHDIKGGEDKIIHIASQFNISHLLERHPYDCSGGEMQKGALACMLLGEPEILFIDEPTKGLDPVSKMHLGTILSQLHSVGLTIVMVTHDIEFAAINAERCAMMFDGEITADGTPESLFKGNYFYTTAINRATRNSNIPEALTLKEAIQRWPNHVLI